MDTSRKTKDKLIFLSIYLAVLVFMIWYNMAHTPVNDGILEYQVYQMNIAEGWQYREGNIVNSCLVTTWAPAIIHDITGWDEYTLFRVFPCFFYPLMPAFVYLIARRYLDYRKSLIAALIVIAGSPILFFPDMGRVGVAWGFLAGMIWALLERRWWWSIIFATLIVFAHYGNAVIAIGVVGVLFAGQLIIKRQFITQYAGVLGILLLLTGLWHFWMAGASGLVMGKSFMLTASSDLEWLSLESREPVLQEAFGLNYNSMNAPQRIELFMNWLIVISIAVGFILMLKRKIGDFNTRLLAFVLFTLILVTAIVPWMSTYYGAQRIYFTALIIISPCVYLAVEYTASKFRIPTYALVAVLIIPYILSVSGLLYLPFGEAK